MSLLLDALRRAEEARRAKEADNIDPASGGAPTDLPTSGRSPVPPPLHELALEEPTFTAAEQAPFVEPDYIAPATTGRSNFALEEIPATQSDFPAAVIPEVAPTRKIPVVAVAADVAQRDAARNVFAAKQPVVERGDKRKWILPVVAFMVVLLGAGGWYVWNEINRVGGPGMARAPSPPVALPQASPSTGQIGPKTVAAAETSPAKPEEAPLPPLLPPPAVDIPIPKIAESSATARPLTAREILAKKIKDAPVPKEGALGLKLARSTEPPRINPELTIAYQSLASGNYALAQKQYARLVAAEPLNIDAQLGLATAAARSGDKASATQHYRRVLALDPRNGLAIMGLVALDEGAQPATLEIELKTLLGRNPDAAPLHFALGNLFASGKRWTEAQQAYFEAFRIDAVNPDYLFNLAVSLDQLRQSRLALDYYQKAERVAAAGGGGQFDRSTLARRIRELGAETGRTN